MTLRAVVGLGANVGDRLATMRAAVGEIARVASVGATSRVFETSPVGGPVQEPFLNAAVAVTFEGSPGELLDALLAIEARLGRVRDVRWGPRSIDLDVLWIDGVSIDTPALVVPHPRLRERAFALAPMADVAPDARDPVTGAPYAAAMGDGHDVRDAGYRL